MRVLAKCMRLFSLETLQRNSTHCNEQPNKATLEL